ncbi:DUF2975 domain-containing protein [Paenibacillus sp. SC116]|uniref:DUF2975 domain-containing protein n=1 Tax=Paenibacillus sp. SC116 TaxID=2968986 RepID=UPI00215A4FDA|nr:DUF2975 domain-containing protein [Paenibacillus sp. SC116]MCR8843582.1 DUF2975 domain-containing protein [Paenibacillus sp. SC116]
MKHATTLFLKIVVFLMALPVLVICVFSVLSLLGATNQFPGKLYVVDIGFFSAIVPYYIALYQTFKLLGYIDKNIAFSELSVRALKKIKYCGFSIGIIFVVMEPVLFVMAQQDDAPGLVVISLAIPFGAFVVGVFGAVLERLLQSAIHLQSENELTV